jgi:hypothetical protein
MAPLKLPVTYTSPQASAAVAFTPGKIYVGNELMAKPQPLAKPAPSPRGRQQQDEDAAKNTVQVVHRRQLSEVKQSV